MSAQESQPARAADRPGEAVDDAAPRTVTAPELEVVAERALLGIGAGRDTATTVAASLVAADVCGHASHGVRRLPIYARFVAAGQIDPSAHPSVEFARGSTARVEGGGGFGQPAALMASERAAELAGEHGVAAVAVSRTAHVGRLGEYTALLAKRDLIGVALCNADPCVAPLGGRERRLGTNPLSIAVPREGRDPILLDWATAALAEGKLSIAAGRGEQVPQGVVIDADGAGATDPGAFYDGGSILPFGGHKGTA